jgi:hypothetical protein
MLKQVLEAFIASPDFKDAVISATIVSQNDEVRIELFPDGTWRKDYCGLGRFVQIKYNSPGVMLLVPPLDSAEMPQFVECGGTQQEWFDLAFNNERDEIAKALRQELD